MARLTELFAQTADSIVLILDSIRVIPDSIKHTPDSISEQNWHQALKQKNASQEKHATFSFIILKMFLQSKYIMTMC